MQKYTIYFIYTSNSGKNMPFLTPSPKHMGSLNKRPMLTRKATHPLAIPQNVATFAAKLKEYRLWIA
jgi:hypothetical protein